MSDKAYIKLILKNVPHDLEDFLTSELFSIGAEGVSEDLKFIQTSQQYDPEIIPKDFIDLSAFFPFSLKEDLESSLSKDLFVNYQPELLIEDHKDWLSEWKKHYEPFQVEDRLWVYPSWEKENIKEEHEAILVDPGLAFGTGTHATTHLCMQALHRNLNESHEFESGLDMGAGTGILSVLMHKRGLKSVQACEIDEMARDKCRENLDLNSCEMVVVCGPDELNTKKVDLVVANIIDGVLLKIKDDLVSRTGKLLILSGILLENEDEVLQAFSSKGLVLTKRSSKDEWACLEFKANA